MRWYNTKYVLFYLNSLKNLILLLLKLSKLEEGGGSRASKHGFAQGANTFNAGSACTIADWHIFSYAQYIYVIFILLYFWFNFVSILNYIKCRICTKRYLIAGAHILTQPPFPEQTTARVTCVVLYLLLYYYFVLLKRVIKLAFFIINYYYG
jgi:hypothetical protein